MAFDGVAEDGSGRRTDLLLKLADVLDGLGDKEYNHMRWVHESPCGTQACALGWAAIRVPEAELTYEKAPGKAYGSFYWRGEFQENSYVAAMLAFNLSYAEATALFSASTEARDFYGVSETHHLLPSLVASRIRDFALGRVTV